MLSLSTIAKMEKNKLEQDSCWLVLLEIAISDTESIRLVRNTEDINWNGYTWIAFPFDLDVISDSGDGEIQSVTVKVSNVTRAVQKYLEDTKGGVGAEVTVMVINSKRLDLVDSFTINTSTNYIKLDSAANAHSFSVGEGNFITNTSSAGWCFISNSTVSMENVILECDVTPQANSSHLGIVLRSSLATKSGYTFVIRNSTLKGSRFDKLINGSSTSGAVDFTFPGFTTGQRCHLKVIAQGNTMSAYVNDALVCSYTDSTYTSGYFGFAPYDGTCIFNNLSVVDLDKASLAVQEEFSVTATTADEKWVSFTLGPSYPVYSRRPEKRYLKNHCQFEYGGIECAVEKATMNTYPTCDRTLTACRARGNSTRYNGEVSIPGGFYV